MRKKGVLHKSFFLCKSFVFASDLSSIHSMDRVIAFWILVTRKCSTAYLDSYGQQKSTCGVCFFFILHFILIFNVKIHHESITPPWITLCISFFVIRFKFFFFVVVALVTQFLQCDLFLFLLYGIFFCCSLTKYRAKACHCILFRSWSFSLTVARQMRALLTPKWKTKIRHTYINCAVRSFGVVFNSFYLLGLIV